MNTNMEVTPLVGIHTYATNAPVVLTINDVQEAGFQARMVNTPMVLDCTQMELNAREKITRENNVNVVYVCFTEEMLDSIKEQGDTIPGLSEDLNMPKFDKLIMATSAGQAVLTTMYHLSEGHNVTNCINKLCLLEQVVDNNAQHLRHGSRMVNIFNRRIPNSSTAGANGQLHHLQRMGAQSTDCLGAPTVGRWQHLQRGLQQVYLGQRIYVELQHPHSREQPRGTSPQQ